jgi:signal transduction histidine kinase
MKLHLDKIKSVLRRALGLDVSELPTECARLFSGAPAQIIQSIFEQGFHLLRPRHIELLVEESNSTRMFRWHSERNECRVVVNSEEFDHSTADPHLQLMPPGNWILRQNRERLVLIDECGKRSRMRENVPAVFLESFQKYTNVMSVVVDLGDEWDGRFLICDVSLEQSHSATLGMLRRFSQHTARSIHAAHLCLRASRETAAEERARLARELHDGTIQSLLGVELRLEGFKHRPDLPSDAQADIGEVQGILRREAMGLRNLVTDSRRRALRPERLLEFLSDLLERFQRDSGIVTRFFADLDSDSMPPRICHEFARMAEEAINNARKHSRASTLTVRLGCVAENWVLVIVDDGVGFDFDGIWALQKLVTSGLGPRVIKERVLALGGDLMIESTATGARVEISVPKRGKLSSRLQLTTLKESSAR